MNVRKISSETGNLVVRTTKSALRNTDNISQAGKRLGQLQQELNGNKLTVKFKDFSTGTSTQTVFDEFGNRISETVIKKAQNGGIIETIRTFVGERLDAMQIANKSTRGNLKKLISIVFDAKGKPEQAVASEFKKGSLVSERILTNP